MHTATRLAVPLIDRARQVNPSARLCAYGLYAPLNGAWLRERGVEVLGPEAEQELVDLINSPNSQVRNCPKRHVANHQSPTRKSQIVPRLRFITPDRAGLPPLEDYASLRMPDGTRRVIGSTDATRGCKHLCRHCPIVPVYEGQFRVVPLDVVMADVRAQVAAGAQHISFGDPDFLNGPTHARHLVERVAAEFPGLSYDVTIKIEHLLKHAEMIPLLRGTGCLFICSAVESIDDAVLRHLRKGHTRSDFVEVARLCREAGITLVPTFVAFTPWTTLEGYVELLDLLEELDLVEQVAPIQLAIRLLVTAGSSLLELDDIRRVVSPFDAASLTWPWRHRRSAGRRAAGGRHATGGRASRRCRAPRPSRAIAALARDHADAAGASGTHDEARTGAVRQRALVLLCRADGGRVKRVLLVATTTGYQIRSFGEAAESLGVRLAFASDRCDQLDDPWWDQAIPVRFHEEARSVDDGRWPPAPSAPIDGIIAVGDRPAVLAARIAPRLGSAGSSAGCGRDQPEQAGDARGVRSRRVCRRPVFWPIADRRRSRLVGATTSLSRRRQTAGAVGQPRRGPCEQRRRSSLAAFERLRRLLSARDVRLERDEAHGHVLIESFIPGTRIRGRRAADHGALQTLADHRQAGPARRSVLRRDDLPHAIDGAAGDPAAHHRGGRRGLRAPSACATALCTPSVACDAAAERDDRASMCSKSPRVRSAGCAHGPCALRRECRRSRRSCCATRSARTCRPTRGKRRRQA